jgi:hypothetical protein
MRLARCHRGAGCRPRSLWWQNWRTWRGCRAALSTPGRSSRSRGSASPARLKRASATATIGSKKLSMKSMCSSEPIRRAGRRLIRHGIEWVASAPPSTSTACATSSTRQRSCTSTLSGSGPERSDRLSRQGQPQRPVRLRHLQRIRTTTASAPPRVPSCGATATV